MLDEGILKTEERAAITLRTLYSKYGYQPYKMSKFEEYDLYARNKDFLVSDSVITFTDTTGKLMALKPDVTLSIIKNYQDEPGVTQRVYYNENVYRVSDETHQYNISCSPLTRSMRLGIIALIVVCDGRPSRQAG